MSDSENFGEPSWQATILRTLVWLVLSVGMIVDVIYLRSAIGDLLYYFADLQSEYLRRNDVLADFNKPGYIATAYDLWIFFFMGLAVAGLSVAMDYYFRKGERIGKLWQRVGLVFAIEVGLVVISLIVGMVLQSIA